jgi:hypothetical protein
MKAVTLCAKMHWDWQQYLSQPQWFINALSAFFNEQAEDAKRRAKP